VRTVLPGDLWPLPRATEDLDFFLPTEIVASLVQFVNLEGSAIWRFKHPTIGDAYAALLLRRPEWLGIYVRGASLDKLLGQITCGDVGLEKAVVLPKTFFSLILRRLDEPSSATQLKTASLRDWHSRHRVDDFLASRCSAKFLTEYLRRHENVFERVSSPGLSLNAASEVDLAVRLNQLGLLPEEYRERFVTTVVDYTIQGDDFYAMESRGIQSMFTRTELAAFRDRVRSELVRPDTKALAYKCPTSRCSLYGDFNSSTVYILFLEARPRVS
jgi:hypothetical protein